MNTPSNQVMGGKLSILEKISYALGDGAANIAWRGVSTFLFVFYTDVFGLAPLVVGTLMLVVRLSDGISDVVMGAICDRTTTRWGKFRPWILWTAIPLAIILSLMFTNPDWDMTSKVIYAYTTYILFTLIYTANNIPYGSLMAVMTPDDQERTSLGSYRMVGAFAGGMLVQGLLLLLVVYFGNVNPKVEVQKNAADSYQVAVTLPETVNTLSLETKNGFANLYSPDIQRTVAAQGNKPAQMLPDTLTTRKSFRAVAGKTYHFQVTNTGGETITADSFRIVDQSRGYSRSIYLLSGFLAVFLVLTFLGTRERVDVPKNQKTNLWNDFKDLIHNKPWLVLVIVALLYNIYNCTKQGITVIYFSHYLHNQLLSAGYLTALMVASILGAMVTAPLSRKMGKKNLFIAALVFSAVVNSSLWFCSATDVVPIFAVGMISEMAAAIFPTLFFTMLGDAADYSEYVNGRRATGLVYSAGSFATKFGGGIAGALTGFILSLYNYNGLDPISIQGAIPGIKGLMSWIPAILCVLAAVLMMLYPLSQQKTTEIAIDLQKRREQA